MGDALSWTLKLNDQISGPANAAKGALDGVGDALTKVQGRGSDGKFQAVPRGFDAAEEKLKAFSGPLSSAFGKDLVDGALSVVGGFKEMDGALDAVGLSLGGVASAAGKVAVALAGVALAGLAMGAKIAIDASEFKKNTLAGLESILGSKDAAAGVYKQIKAFADTSPFETQFVATQFKSLLGTGLSGEATEKILKGIFDVSALQGFDTQVAESLTRTISKIEGMGKLTGEALTQISEQSGGTVSRSKVLDALAKQTGKSLDEVNRLLAAGKIDAKQGVDAILEAIRTGVSGGELGGLSGKLGGSSITGLSSTIKSKFTGLFEDVDTGPLAKGLQAIVQAFDGPAGAKAKATIERVFGGLFSAIGKALTPENIEAALNTISTVVDVVSTKVSGLITGFEALGKVIEVSAAPLTIPLDAIDQSLAALGVKTSATSVVTSAALSTMGDALLWIVGGPFVAIAEKTGEVVDQSIALWDQIKGPVSDATSGIGDSISGLWDSMTSVFSGLWDSFVAIGGQIIDGLVQGISAGAGAVVDALGGVVDSAIAAAKAALGIASPSKVFASLGNYTAEGFAIGVAANDNAPSAVADLVTPPPASVAKAAGRVAGAAAGGRAGGGNVYTITIHAPGGDARAIRSELHDLLLELDATGTG